MLVRRLAAVALLPLLAACSGGKPPVGAAPNVPSPGEPTASSPVKPTASSCPPAGGTAIQWPAGIPANFPKPPGGRITKTQTGPNGLSIVQLSTPVSLREGVLFILTELPKAGYRLGRGDAEAAEADAPFQLGSVSGVVRLVATEKSCETVWVVAAASGRGNGGGQFMPFPQPSASPSLPFG